jgi:hypothetical protein
MIPLLRKIENWEVQARQLRRVASSIQDPEKREIVLSVAADYERRAAAKRAGSDSSPLERTAAAVPQPENAADNSPRR